MKFTDEREQTDEGINNDGHQYNTVNESSLSATNIPGAIFHT